MFSIRLRLIGFVGGEAPVAAVCFQEFRGILANGAARAVGLAEGVGRRADLDVEPAVGTEGKGLGVVLAAIGQLLDDALRAADGHKFAGS